MNETMLDYIMELDSASKNIIENVDKTLDSFMKCYEEKKPQNWLVIATGSSYNAITSARLYMEKIAGISIEVIEPFMFTKYESMKDTTDLVIGISQSGKSSSTVEALKKLKNTSDISTVALTLNVYSPITKWSDIVIDLGCGEEKVGYVTKGFTATVLLLMLMGIKVGLANNTISSALADTELYEFNRIVEEIPNAIKTTEQFYQSHFKELTKIPRFAFVGYGPNYGTAKEAETKFTETVRVPTQGFELEAFMHGPYLEVDADYGIVIIQTDSKNNVRANQLLEYFSKYTSHCFSISCIDNSYGKSINIDLELDEFKSPLILTVPIQLLSYRIACGRGIDLSEEIFEDFDSFLKSKI